MSKGLKIDFKGLLNSQWVEGIGRQWGTYEKKIKTVLTDVDSLSREAREKGKAQLDSFSQELKKRRSTLESKVLNLVNKEADKLNTKLSSLVDYLKSLSQEETKKAAPTKKASPRKSSGASKKSSAKKVMTDQGKSKTSKKGLGVSAVQGNLI
jgi:hypothetical protein